MHVLAVAGCVGQIMYVGVTCHFKTEPCALLIGKMQATTF